MPRVKTIAGSLGRNDSANEPRPAMPRVKTIAGSLGRNDSANEPRPAMAARGGRARFCSQRSICAYQLHLAKALGPYSLQGSGGASRPPSFSLSRLRISFDPVLVELLSVG